MSRARRVLGIAAGTIGVAGALAAAYGAAGTTGLVDGAALAALGVLILARGMIPGEKPPLVRRKNRRKGPALRAADFPAYTTIASDLEWARMSRRHYEHGTRPLLTRLAVTLGRPRAAAQLAAAPPDAARALDPDGPGADLATLERIVTALEAEP